MPKPANRVWCRWILILFSVVAALPGRTADSPSQIRLIPFGRLSFVLSSSSSSTLDLSSGTNSCGAISGQARWVQIRVVTNATLTIDTIGSGVDTVLSVYSGTNLLSFQFIACNKHGAADSVHSLVQFAASSGATYFVAVDSLPASAGIMQLNFCLGDPSTITAQPQSQTLNEGADAVFSVNAVSGGTLRYQWRLNGINLPGATNRTLVLNNITKTNGGSYSVVVANECAATTSHSADLIVALPVLLVSDAFGGGPTNHDSSGAGLTNNLTATRQGGEPSHAGEPGGKSVWFTWQAAQDGFVTFSTRGSSFDTLLAVYTGTSISNLALVASDDDGGGFSASSVKFTTAADTVYQIAVDGFGAASGNLLLDWNFEFGPPVAQITNSPASRVVPAGDSVTFRVGAINGAGYQWYFNGAPLASAVASTLTIANVQAPQVGNYFVRVFNIVSESVDSAPAQLEIGPNPAVFSRDKFQDLFLAAGNSANFVPAAAPPGIVSVSLGTIQSQIFNNTGSTTQIGETNHCGVLGGSSRWYGLRTHETDSWFQLDTTGSSIPVVLAVYTGADFLSLRNEACAQPANPNLLRFPARPEVDYYVAVDGTNGAQGIIRMSYGLGRLRLVQAPTNQIVPIRATASFAVAAEGVPEPVYQWYWGSNRLAQATNSFLVLTNIQTSQAGLYSVTISNLAGLTNSAAELRVTLPVTIGYERVHRDGLDLLRLIGPVPATSTNRYVIEGTTNLIDWRALWTNGTPTWITNFVDPESAIFRQRFYRFAPFP